MKPIYKILTFVSLLAFSTLLIPNSGNQFKANASALSTDQWEIWNNGSIDPCQQPLRDVSMISASDGWAVGDNGAIFHWNGIEWSMVSSPTSQSLFGVHMLSATDGWAVGNVGVIIHWDGSQWTLESSPVAEDLSDVYILSTKDGWAVGDGGVTLHWDGSAWSHIPSPTTSYLNSVDMISSGNVWAVGGSTILHWNGSIWSQETSPNENIWLFDIDMVSTTDGWAVGSDFNIFRWDGIEWEVWLVAYPSNGAIYDITMISATDGWAVGDFGSIMHWNGINWEYTTGLDSNKPMLYAIDMVTSSDGWIVGSTGAILQYDGNNWSDYIPPPALTINYNSGAPGSYFTFIGCNFPSDSIASISVNNYSLGTVQTNVSGSFTFLLDTTLADEGYYFVNASVNPSSTVSYVLNSDGSLRPQEGSGTIFDVPSGIAYTNTIYLPNVQK